MSVSSKLFLLGLTAAIAGGAPAPQAPVNTVAPAVSGTTTVAQVLSVTDGTWTGDPVITFSYNWKRGGVSIGAPDQNTYTLVQADAGSTITCTVTGTNGVGNSSATSAATAEIMDAAAAAFFARISSQPNAARKTLYNTLFRSLRTGAVSGSNILAKGDALVIHAAHDAQTSLLSLLSATFDQTAVNAPTFTVDSNYSFDGITQELLSNFNPTTAVSPQYTQNSGSFGIWYFGTVNTTGNFAGWVDGTPDGTNINPNAVSGNTSGRLNQASSLVGTGTAGAGWHAMNRSASNACQYYKNGASAATASTVSTAVNNGTFRMGRTATASYSVGNGSAMWIGGSLTANEHLDLYNAIRAFMTGVGVP